MKPTSTAMVWPVMNEDATLMRNEGPEMEGETAAQPVSDAIRITSATCSGVRTQSPACALANA